MDPRLLRRRLPAISCVSAIIAIGAMTAACGKETEAPETTTTTTSAPAPSEKSINPTGGNCSLRRFGDSGAGCKPRTASWYQRGSVSRRLP
jgi:hypothetical protein